jgi:hypothetical protein
VTRFIVATLGIFVGLGVIGAVAARFFGRKTSRLSALVSVIVSWMGAFAVWSFAVALAARWGFIAGDEAGWFGIFALVGGWWHYRVRVASGPERGLVVFIGAQLVWLLLLLYRNGHLSP